MTMNSIIVQLAKLNSPEEASNCDEWKDAMQRNMMHLLRMELGG